MSKMGVGAVKEIL